MRRVAVIIIILVYGFFIGCSRDEIVRVPVEKSIEASGPAVVQFLADSLWENGTEEYVWRCAVRLPISQYCYLYKYEGELLFDSNITEVSNVSFEPLATEAHEDISTMYEWGVDNEFRGITTSYSYNSENRTLEFTIDSGRTQDEFEQSTDDWLIFFDATTDDDTGPTPSWVSAVAYSSAHGQQNTGVASSDTTWDSFFGNEPTIITVYFDDEYFLHTAPSYFFDAKIKVEIGDIPSNGLRKCYIEWYADSYLFNTENGIAEVVFEDDNQTIDFMLEWAESPPNNWTDLIYTGHGAGVPNTSTSEHIYNMDSNDSENMFLSSSPSKKCEMIYASILNDELPNFYDVSYYIIVEGAMQNTYDVIARFDFTWEGPN